MLIFVYDVYHIRERLFYCDPCILYTTLYSSYIYISLINSYDLLTYVFPVLVHQNRPSDSNIIFYNPKEKKKKSLFIIMSVPLHSPKAKR